MAEVNRSAGIEAAKLAGQSAAMDAAAAKLVLLAKADAQKHRDSGAFADSIVALTVPGKRGVLDRLVVANDPLAAVKEFGHVIRREKDGPDLGYVPGQHSMKHAVDRIPEARGD